MTLASFPGLAEGDLWRETPNYDNSKKNAEARQDTGLEPAAMKWLEKQSS